HWPEEPAPPEPYRFGGKTVHEVFSDPRVAALAEAACFGNADNVADEVSQGADPNATGLEGMTPLLWAVGCHNPDGVGGLLKAGGDPNRRWTGGGYSAVYMAAWSHGKNTTLVLKVLLKHGGDPNTTDIPDGRTAIHRAMEIGMDTGDWGNWYALLDGGVD